MNPQPSDLKFGRALLEAIAPAPLPLSREGGERSSVPVDLERETRSPSGTAEEIAENNADPYY